MVDGINMIFYIAGGTCTVEFGMTHACETTKVPQVEPWGLFGRRMNQMIMTHQQHIYNNMYIGTIFLVDLFSLGMIVQSLQT